MSLFRDLFLNIYQTVKYIFFFKYKTIYLSVIGYLYYFKNLSNNFSLRCFIVVLRLVQKLE